MKQTVKEKKHNRFRLVFQLAAAVLMNGYITGFFHGKIFTGSSKQFCLPVLNCYSCPGALGSCPIGAMQAVLGGANRKITFYVLGTLMLFGTVLGRVVCGFACPFGLIQDLLHKIPTRKITVPHKVDKAGRYLKYLMLFVLVIIFPLFVTNEYGVGAPAFCKFFCPAGTLEGGIPHMLFSSSLRQMAGFLFNWKVAVLVFILLGSVFVSRFFCRYFCPLGAFYSFFNRFALYRMHVDQERCVGCKKCEKVCPMAVKVTQQINSGECIRCGKCKAACPTEAISSGFMLKPRVNGPAKTPEEQAPQEQ